MIKRFLLLFIVLFANFFVVSFSYENVKQDNKTREINYKYKILRDDAEQVKERKKLNLAPTGYMTVDEYEALSEYKDKSSMDIALPKIETPSDFKYVPKPKYKIVKYNSPPGSPELVLGKELYKRRQLNTQGVVSPDYSKLVYSVVYYYPDSTSVASDVFVINLDKDSADTAVNRILKASVIKKEPNPILSTDKSIGDFASFRTLTPVDFSVDGSKILIKRKHGSMEDGIWETSIFVYDFNNRTDYYLSEVREAISYFWAEYMDVDLENYRWDIYPLGFSVENPERVVVQGYAFTGEKPVFLGTWSVDYRGNQSRLVTFDALATPDISVNGLKVVRDGFEEYTTTERVEKDKKKLTKEILKDRKSLQKEQVKEIDDEYKYSLKLLRKQQREEFRDYRKQRTFTGSTDDLKFQDAYKRYLVDQYQKDIEKSEKDILKLKKELEKIDKNIEKLYEKTGNSSKVYDEIEDTSPEAENNDDYLIRELNIKEID